MNTTETPKATLSQAASLLFHIAARSHTLAELFGLDVTTFDEQPLKLYAIARPWLTRHPRSGDRSELLTFDPDRFAEKLDACSSGQRHMMLFILNVWNSNYAKNKGWQFDLFKALDSLDEQNRRAIAWWLKHPIWP